VALAACGGRGRGPVPPPEDPDPGRQSNLAAILLRELEAEVLEGYATPTFDAAVPGTAVSARVGAVQLGVRPEDVYAAPLRPVERWPLPVLIDGVRRDRVFSKRLDLRLAADLSAAWVVDELSYRVPGCTARDGTTRTAVIPLRFTALYVRDGERWVEVLEHVSYPRRVAELVEAAGPRPVGKAVRAGRDLRPEAREPEQVVRRALAPELSDADRRLLFAADPGAVALWAGPEQELRGGVVLRGATLAQAFDAASVKVRQLRVGMSPDPAGGVGGGAVAWAAATLEVAARRVRGEAVETVPLRLRGTFVLERRLVDGERRWQIVQSHVSAPIDARALLTEALGASAVAGDTWPWEHGCEGFAPTP
jgi:hypothetical protein